jgi:hypothetical protein
MTMTDEVMKELWATKDKIANEHRCNIDELAEYFLQKQSARRRRFHCVEQDAKAEQSVPSDVLTSRG